MRTYLTILICIFISSCVSQSEQKENNRRTIARVYDNYLYLDEIENLVNKGTPEQDSTAIVKNFIANWTKEQAVLYIAEKNLGEEEKNVEQQLNEYRNSLINYIYQLKLVSQQLDTVVSETEIETYYNNNKRNFELKDNIVKVLYVKVNSKAPKLNKVRNWVKSENDPETSGDRKQLESYCVQFASDYFMQDSIWVPFDELLIKVPIKTYDKEQFLRNNRFIETNDSLHTYFIHIKDFKVKESLSPLSFEKENIRNVIINKRKLNLIKESEKQAYDRAISEKEIEIYE